MIFVTGGAGFIGSNFIAEWLVQDGEPVLNIDKLTYAGNLESLADVCTDRRYAFVQGDIADRALIGALLLKYRPRAILNFAAESHVDRSISGPEDFIQTNIVGTFRLLDAAREYWSGLADAERAAFRFLHVSTDEVFGSLGPTEPAFSELSSYQPNSPYSASKAAADHLVRAYHHTYGLPVLTTNCSNNYGPYQYPEKLVPLVIHRALAGQPLPVYGDGMQVRDWLFVGDHCGALRRVLESGRPGEVYNIGGGSEMTNIALVSNICELLDLMRPRPDARKYAEQIRFVTDRPGHDRRYAIDSGKICRELDWRPAETFASGLQHTVRWYLEHQDWVAAVLARQAEGKA